VEQEEEPECDDGGKGKEETGYEDVWERKDGMSERTSEGCRRGGMLRIKG
jgi:hypothetical protein